MVPIKLQLHNFLSYREPAPLDFQSFNLAVLSGNNGVGKSSILEAITWVIWGETRAGSDDDLIHQGTTGCWVEFVFEHENSLYRIVRKREFKGRAGQSILEFQTRHGNSSTLLGDNHWQSITEATLKTTNEKIISILKIPYEIFVNSSYLRQGHADEFTIKTPAERKEILAEVLGLNYYEELSTKAREKMRRLEEKTKMLVFQIEDLQSQIARKKEIESHYQETQKKFKKIGQEQKILKANLAKLDKDRQEYVITSEKLKILRERFVELSRVAQKLNLEKENFEKEQERIQEQLKNKEAIKVDYKKLLRLETKNEEEIIKYKNFVEINQELKVLEHIKNDLDKNTKRINQISNCPMCLRPMTKPEASKIVAHLKKEFQEKYQKKFDSFKKEIQKINYDFAVHQDIQEQIKTLATIRETYQALGLAENNLKNTQKNLKNILANFSKLKDEAEKITNKGTSLKKKLPKLEQVNLVWQEKMNEEDILNKRIMELQNSLGGLKQELVQIEKEEKELKEIEREQQDIQKEIREYEELSLAFGKKGIQAMIIEQSLLSIEEGANMLLGKITGGRMSLKFITQKAKKSPSEEDELIETLEIKIADELGERDYEMYSGGEAFRINFAIRIALSKLLASRADAHLKFLAIDEGFGMLDMAGRDDLVAAINSISPDFEKILVITHFQELKDLFPTKIEVTKDENGSHLEIVA